MAFPPAARVLLRKPRDGPAPPMSPQLHGKKEKLRKKQDASQTLPLVGGSTRPTCQTIPLFLPLPSFGAGQSMRMALFPAWQATSFCSSHKGLQPQAFR